MRCSRLYRYVHLLTSEPVVTAWLYEDHKRVMARNSHARMRNELEKKQLGKYYFSNHCARVDAVVMSISFNEKFLCFSVIIPVRDSQRRYRDFLYSTRDFFEIMDHIYSIGIEGWKEQRRLIFARSACTFKLNSLYERSILSFFFCSSHQVISTLFLDAF